MSYTAPEQRFTEGSVNHVAEAMVAIRVLTDRLNDLVAVAVARENDSDSWSEEHLEELSGHLERWAKLAEALRQENTKLARLGKSTR